MNSNDEDSLEVGHAASSSSSSPLVRKPPLSRPTILTRLSRTMSQVFEKDVLPPTSRAPPASPHSEHEDASDMSSPPPPDPRPQLPPPLTKGPKVSMLLENSGSVARDHLASERTFLAYVRTSLAIASTGVALVQLFTVSAATTTNGDHSFLPTARRVQAWARPLGATMVCFGLVVLTIGTIRYFRIQSALITGMYPVARLSSAGVTLVLGTIIVIVFAVMLAGHN